MSSDNVLCLFIKAPIPGHVKTRLQPEVNQVDALALYRAMGLDVLNRFNTRSGFDLVLFFWPGDSKPVIQDWLGSHHTLFSQRGKDLGERMYNAFLWAQSKGYKKTIVLGTDIPSVTRGDIDMAFLVLDTLDIVLGPTHDGGYYLIGMKKPWESLFQGIPWSAETVLQRTVDRIKVMGKTVDLLDKKHDIDTYEDVMDLWRSLRSKSKTLSPREVKETYQVLKTIFSRQTLEDYDS